LGLERLAKSNQLPFDTQVPGFAVPGVGGVIQTNTGRPGSQYCTLIEIMLTQQNAQQQNMYSKIVPYNVYRK
jgi:hypothetical protein